jgi:hypothetical protein
VRGKAGGVVVLETGSKGQENEYMDWGEKIELMNSKVFKLFRPITGNAINNCDFVKKFAFSARSDHSGYALQTLINIATPLSAATTRDRLDLG